jgi:transcriptional regulator with XRE-family HTH domain
MESEPWQRRLKSLGLKQNEFAEAVGLTPTNLSEGLRGKWKTGVPTYLKALIIALELLGPEDRTRWLATARAARLTSD